eukprot:1160526-Pelagomonas_calceolata.AAC.18
MAQVQHACDTSIRYQDGLAAQYITRNFNLSQVAFRTSMLAFVGSGAQPGLTPHRFCSSYHLISLLSTPGLSTTADVYSIITVGMCTINVGVNHTAVHCGSAPPPWVCAPPLRELVHNAVHCGSAPSPWVCKCFPETGSHPFPGH